jgi:S-(hydroxymethyl)glutathione dehydrogenase / alcohol dehydrogenase
MSQTQGVSFQAAVLEQLNAPLSVERIKNNPLEFGHVLVRIRQSGICGAQLNEIAGVKGPDKFLPHLMGHEGGGEIVEVGPGVKKVKAGDRVVVHWRKGSGIEGPFPSYNGEKGRIGGGLNTTFSEYTVASENRVTKIESDIPFEIAALLGCGVTTGFGIVTNEAKLTIGESIAVFGCGGVGLNVIQAAACVSANPIIAVDVVEGIKKELALKMGATHFVNAKTNPALDAIQQLVKGGVDVAVDTTGNTGVINDAFESLAQGGRLVLVGQPRFDRPLELKKPLSFFGDRVMFASNGGGSNPDRDIPRLSRLYRAGRLDLGSIITHRFPLEKVNEAIDLVRSGECGRVMLDMHDDRT